jgi:hypothetical protein
MGTLFDQPVRNRQEVPYKDIEYFLETSCQLALDYDVSISDVIQARKVLEMERANTLRVGNGDIFDEQMGGFGELLRELISSLSSDSALISVSLDKIAEALEDVSREICNLGPETAL